MAKIKIVIEFFLTSLTIHLIVGSQECGLPHNVIRITGFVQGTETNVDKVTFKD